MLELANQTDWQAGLFPGWGLDRRFQWTLAVKRTFRFTLDGATEEALPGPELVLADEHRGDPDSTSLTAASEIVPFKQGSEFLLTGTAHPPKQPARVMTTEVVLKFADGRPWQKVLRVTGRRHWKRGVLGLMPGDPAPLEPLPIAYEYAFGGIDKQRRAMDLRNRVGLGFAKDGKVANGQRMPSIEQGPKFIAKPGHQPAPAGYGPIPATWQPRYDDNRDFNEEAMESGGGCPYPQNVPPAMYNAAPRDQRFPQPFTGGEEIALRGFFPELEPTVPVRIRLPETRPEAFVQSAGKRSRAELVCDTLVVDADAREISLVWRAGIPRRMTETRKDWVVLRDAAASRENAA